MSLALAALMVFVQLSDPQFGWYEDPGCYRERKCMESVVVRTNQIKPLFVIITGNMVDALPGDRRRNSQVANFLLVVSKIKSRVMFVPGNHDVGNKPTLNSIAEYWEAFGPDFYGFEAGEHKFLVLNSSLMRQPEFASKRAKSEWDLAKEVIEKEKPIAVFAHHPLFRFDHDEVENYYNWPKEPREKMLGLLKGSSVKWFITGHTHLPGQFEHNGMTMFTAGSPTAPRLDSQPEMIQWTIDKGKLYPKRIRLSCLRKGK